VSVRSDFPVTFREFIFNRACVQIGEDMIIDPEYQGFAQKANGLYHEIAKALGEKRNLISDMDSLMTGCESVVMERAYAQGLHDGISMLKELSLLGASHVPQETIERSEAPC
jgi:hypothetical protein